MPKRTTFSRNGRLSGNRIPCQEAISQPASRPAGRPNLDARRRSFRRRNVNRRFPPVYVSPVEIACVISFAEVWLRSVSRHRKFQVVTSPLPRVNRRGETIGCPSRTPLAAITRLRVWDRLVHTPRYRSLSVIDERHFCNDSPTCDFSILKGGGRARQRDEQGRYVPRHLNAADVYVMYVKSIIVLSSSVMRERIRKYCNSDEMTLHIAYILTLQ